MAAREALKQYIETLFELATLEGGAEAASAIVDLETRLAEVQLGTHGTSQRREKIQPENIGGTCGDEKAQAKLAKIDTKIGYTEKWRDYSKLDVDPEDLIGNVKASNRVEYFRNIDKLGKPIDRKEWGMTPQTVNAYYNPAKNEIVFPAAILQSPFFSPETEDALNYGGIGAVIGHEISHAFDDQGSKYDGDGNMINWWTDEDRKAFKTLTDPHSPSQYRANGPVTNIDAFYQAFDLQEGDRLFKPVDVRIKIW